MSTLALIGTGLGILLGAVLLWTAYGEQTKPVHHTGDMAGAGAFSLFIWVPSLAAIGWFGGPEAVVDAFAAMFLTFIAGAISKLIAFCWTQFICRTPSPEGN